MSQDDNVVDTIDTFPRREDDQVIESLIGKHVDGALESGARFWGVLESFDEKWLFLRGYRNQPIIIRRRKMASLMEAV